MFNKLKILTIALVSILSLNLYANSPEEVIKNVFLLASNNSINTNKELQSDLEQFIDFDQMALSILGTLSNGKTFNQINWFKKSIKEIITKSIYPKAPDFLNGVKISYRNTLEDNNTSTVPSIVNKRGERTDVSYQLKKINSNWKVIDVSIDGDSWVKTINDNIKSTYKKGGWNEIQKLLNQKIKELK